VKAGPTLEWNFQTAVLKPFSGFSSQARTVREAAASDLETPRVRGGNPRGPEASKPKMGQPGCKLPGGHRKRPWRAQQGHPAQ